MRWHGLKLKMDGDGLGTRVWKLLWEASVAGEQVDEGNAVFAAPDGQDCFTLYFPPAAQLLASSVGARHCPKPQGPGLTVLAGHERAWQVHFDASAADALPRMRVARAA
jgi:hypothetical protein